MQVRRQFYVEPLVKRAILPLLWKLCVYQAYKKACFDSDYSEDANISVVFVVRTGC